MSRVPALILAALLTATVTGCGRDETPVAGPTAAPSPTPVSASASALVDDPPGTLTCAALAQAIADSSLMTPGVVDGIARVSGTADAPVADAAGRLLAAYGKAVLSVGKDDEPDAVAAVSAAASDMSSVCSDSGLQTVG
ncbi:hypothetical protein KOI35_39330 [Actinoplanes bogorensis]|uniref:Lipoprotein n=1 Tax=Paractinoplanes bogorensis TaxID=1610840 RepID=A0ABS5Z1K5_9ACTN|nr:hypothetical protein [Actinoplanes bogorensis]MBU2669581.1 hypothetical protein [Actinoplanes bogorensis]